MPKILAINGSYRIGGVTDQLIEAMKDTLEKTGADVETVFLRDYRIEFCLNCRKCTQRPGESPSRCIIEDGMAELIDRIEKSDGYILASPTNVGSATAVFKKFMERLAVYAYWPWGAKAPRYRKEGQPPKKAVLVSSCAAPALLGRLFFCTMKELKATAKTINAEPAGTVFAGLVADKIHHRISEKIQRKARSVAIKLLK